MTTGAGLGDVLTLRNVRSSGTRAGAGAGVIDLRGGIVMAPKAYSALSISGRRNSAFVSRRRRQRADVSDQRGHIFVGHLRVVFARHDEDRRARRLQAMTQQRNPVRVAISCRSPAAATRDVRRVDDKSQCFDHRSSRGRRRWRRGIPSSRASGKDTRHAPGSDSRDARLPMGPFTSMTRFILRSLSNIAAPAVIPTPTARTASEPPTIFMSLFMARVFCIWKPNYSVPTGSAYWPGRAIRS